MKSDNYVVIQGWMCNELELKGNELLIFALIYGFSQDDISEFSGGRKYIADTFNISIRTVENTLQSLLDKGYIEKSSAGDYIHTDHYWVNRSITNNEGSEKISSGVAKKFRQGSEKISPNNIKNNLKDNIDTNTNVLVEQPTAVRESKTHTKTSPLIETSPVSDTSNKPKKKNLYEKCMDLIDEYTSDSELKSLLQEFLKTRLSRKDIPFNTTTFRGMLRKLDTLSDSRQNKAKIIQQSIDRVYPTFYPLLNSKGRQGQNTDVFSEYGQVHAVRSREENRSGVQF